MTVRARRSPTTRTLSRARSADLTLLAAFAGLLFIAGPLGTVIDTTLGDVMSAVAFLFAVPVVLTRVNRVPRIAVWLLVFVMIYVISARVADPSGQGVRHALAAGTVAAVILLFSTYGSDMVRLRPFRWSAYALILGGIGGVWMEGWQKNLTGGTLLYLLALLTMLVLTQRHKARVLVVGFFVIATLLAFSLDFRGLIGYAAVLVIGYVGAVTLPRRAFWLVGVVGSSAVVAATIWYFLNVFTDELAVTVTRLIIDASGRPATSGRDWLWPGIIDAVGRANPVAGLGAGTLPRDIMPTNLSAHSSYLQVYLQLGFVGLVALTMVLLAVWKPLAASVRPAGHFGAALFLMFVTHNATEVLMFQNALMVAVPAWAAIGLAVSLSTGAEQPTGTGDAGFLAGRQSQSRRSRRSPARASNRRAPGGANPAPDSDRVGAHGPVPRA